MFDFLTGTEDQPMYLEGEHFNIDHTKVGGGLIIKTLEGDHLARFSDWIIKGVNGDFHLCKHEIFEKTYELVEEDNS